MIAVFRNLHPSGWHLLYSNDGSAYSVAWWMYSSLTFICPHFCAFDRTNIPSMHWTAMSILAEEVSSEDGIQCDWFQYSTCDGQIVSPIPLWLSYVRLLAHLIVRTYQVRIGQLLAFKIRSLINHIKCYNLSWGTFIRSWNSVWLISIFYLWWPNRITHNIRK